MFLHQTHSELNEKLIKIDYHSFSADIGGTCIIIHANGSRRLPATHRQFRCSENFNLHLESKDSHLVLFRCTEIIEKWSVEMIFFAIGKKYR